MSSTSAAYAIGAKCPGGVGQVPKERVRTSRETGSGRAMTNGNDKRGTILICRGVLVTCAMVLGDGALAGVTLDGTLGPAKSLSGPDYVIPARDGETRGGNLFHSFGQFSLTSRESASFTGPAEVHNIVGRVTGGEVPILTVCCVRPSLVRISISSTRAVSYSALSARLGRERIVLCEYRRLPEPCGWRAIRRTEPAAPAF